MRVCVGGCVFVHVINTHTAYTLLKIIQHKKNNYIPTSPNC